MRYEYINVGTFLERPNRFIAYVEINGKKETVHVKNTGRCKELLIPGTTVYVQESQNPARKTKWDLIAVKKGDRLINMDSQIPNFVVREWLEKDGLPEIGRIKSIRPEYTYGESRIDLYIETDTKKILMEVKGVTLEEEGVVRFPDAPSERAVKHVKELEQAQKMGYDSYVCFVIQMENVAYFTPNVKTHEAFGKALLEAAEKGVQVLAIDCIVTPDEICAKSRVPVVLRQPILYEMQDDLIHWYQKEKRDLPWRHEPEAYKVWVSEIMLQQTRVEAVKAYYTRFLERLPNIKALAECPEDELLKLWEGLGYYNRVRNMQLAAKQILEEYNGVFPSQYDEILKLKGIGSYTAGAISAFAFGIPKPAVDGNVLRVLSRILCIEEEIGKLTVKRQMEAALEEVIPTDQAADYVQGLIELGAIVCVPNGEPKCLQCPVRKFCKAYAIGRQLELPNKAKQKKRKIEKRTIFVFRDGETVALKKRPAKGLLAGLYELPGIEGELTQKAVIAYCKQIGLQPVKVTPFGEAKHIFSHVEWHMTGWLVQVDELEKSCKEKMLFLSPQTVEEEYPIPSAFEAYAKYLNIKLGHRRKHDENNKML